ncbi:hypothetical protein ABIB17_003960 [Arthrobacter sp. UYEF6]
MLLLLPPPGLRNLQWANTVQLLGLPLMVGKPFFPRMTDTTDMSMPTWVTLRYDSSDAASVKQVTTVHQNLRQQGAACALAAITGASTPAPHPWQLITGKTTR